MPDKKRVKKKNVATKIVSVIVALGLVCLVAGVIVLFILLQGKPELVLDDLVSEQSSIIYDRNGEEIGEVGSVMRENITYDDLPNVLVDAFVAVEDSRFFEHNGFDVPRFTQAIIENLRTLSFEQGGSTFTMQLVKNTYFVDDESGTGAVKSIERKVQEIALALELERSIDKKTVLELYLNRINFGGQGNIRGIQRAAQYYFDKDVSELNLAESALLAGVINAPNAYNPHNNLELATERRNTVLYLMHRHGYIDDTEYALALSIKVEDLLVDPNYKGDAGEGNQYQAYIDQVISEVIDLTGYDPTAVSMRIYTAMDQGVQSLMDDIQDGNVIQYPDDQFEVASIAIDNHTGEIVGILGGRNYSYGGELLLNHATAQYNQPGSSIKPMLDYALAFENLGWATSHVLVDRPLMWAGTDVVVTNSTNTYQGEVRLKDAVGNSLNTPAIQTLQSVIDEIGSTAVVEYMNALGFDVTVDEFNLQYAIGGSTFAASCLQLASAQSTMFNGGVRVEPHTVIRIEFMNGHDPIEPSYDTYDVLSEESAYLVTDLLYSNVHDGYANLMGILQDDYATYAKTGTTDWGSAGSQYGIPNGTARDGWMIGSTSEYTTATWIGYDSYNVNSGDEGAYLSNSKYLMNIQGQVTNLLLDQTVESFGTPEAVTRPSTVSEIEHILGTFPYASVLEGMNESLIARGLIASDDVELVDPSSMLEVDTVMESSGFEASVGANGTISVSWPMYPDPEDLIIADSTMDISLRNANGDIIVQASGTRLFDYSWIYGPISYKADIKIDGEVIETISSENSSTTQSIDSDLDIGDEVEVCGYYGYEDAPSGEGSNQVCQIVTVTRDSGGSSNVDALLTIDAPSIATVGNVVTFYAEVSDYYNIDEEAFTWQISGSGIDESVSGSDILEYTFRESGTYTVTCYYDVGMLSLSDRIRIVVS